MSSPLSHRIKGTHKKKGARGNIVEYSGAEKAPFAVKVALADQLRSKGFSPAVTDLTVEKFLETKKGDLLKKVYQNNRYTANGTITYFLREHDGDKVHDKQTDPYSIVFEDALDANGMPEMKIVSFKVG